MAGITVIQDYGEGGEKKKPLTAAEEKALYEKELKKSQVEIAKKTLKKNGVLNLKMARDFVLQKFGAIFAPPVAPPNTGEIFEEAAKEVVNEQLNDQKSTN